jgi:hypothetical protein
MNWIRLLPRVIHETPVWTADYRTAGRVKQAGPRKDVALEQKDVDAGCVHVREWDSPAAAQALRTMVAVQRRSKQSLYACSPPSPYHGFLGAYAHSGNRRRIPRVDSVEVKAAARRAGLEVSG